MECQAWKECRKKTVNMEDLNALELVSLVTEMNDIHTFLNDPDLDEAMAALIKLKMNSNLKPSTAQRLIVELQAYAAIFAFKATYYATIGKAGTDESHKKNVYYTAKEAINLMVNSLKFTAKGELYG